jgi:uncharacterized protein YkwD
VLSKFSRSVRVTTLLALVAAAGGLLAVAGTPTPAGTAAPLSVESEIIRLTNVERQKVGAPPLRASAKIAQAAAAYAALMAKLDKMDHHLDGKDAGQRLTAAGYQWQSWGENIAFNFPNAASVVQAWMSDEGHKQNLLNPNFTEIGVGVAFNAKGQPYYDQVFARPAQ